MRKIAEKIAIVAQICISLVFVATGLLYHTNVVAFPQQQLGVTSVVMWVLAFVWVATSLYVLYCNFSEQQTLKKLLLFSNSNSATVTNHKVVGKIVANCARLVQGVKLKKFRIRTDEKQGFSMRLSITFHGKDVALATEKLRCLLVDTFANTLGVTFNTINFEICKFSTTYSPSIDKATEIAEQRSEDRLDKLQCDACADCPVGGESDEAPTVNDEE